MKFSQVLGNPTVKKKLMAGISEGRIAHAQLFTSRVGGGNLAMALAYVQYLFCKDRKEDDSCGVCDGCRKVSRIIHPDLHFAFPLNTNKKIKKDPLCNDFMDEWRAKLIENPYMSVPDWAEELGVENKAVSIPVREAEEILRKLNYRPYEADYKVMIIWSPEYLHHLAIPKLLKIIEEPPGQTVFILVSSSPDEILNTITSRTQLVKLKQILDFEMLDALIEQAEGDMHAAGEIVNICDGDYNLAKKLITDREDTMNLNTFMNWMRACYDYQVKKFMDIADEIHDYPKEKQKKFLAYSLHMMRETLIKNAGVNDLERTTPGETSFMQRFHSNLTPDQVMIITEHLEKAISLIDRNVYVKLMISDISIYISDIFSVIRNQTKAKR
jgi:DNA polymerase-3 subunit delta'